jgi:hypothetical protein
VRTLVVRLAREPAAQGLGLLLAQGAQGHVHIPIGDVDVRQAGGVGRIARDIARALTVSDDPESGGPALLHVMRNT